jgi:hypothetical protein
MVMIADIVMYVEKKRGRSFMMMTTGGKVICEEGAKGKTRI